MTSSDERELARYAARAIAASLRDEARDRERDRTDFRNSISAVGPEARAQLAKKRRGPYLSPKPKPSISEYPVLRAARRRSEVRIWKCKDATQLGRVYWLNGLRPPNLPLERQIYIAKQRYDAGCTFVAMKKASSASGIDSTQREIINNSLNGALLPMERAAKARSKLERIRRQLPEKTLAVLELFLVEDLPISTAFEKVRGHHLKEGAMPLLGKFLDELVLAIGDNDAPDEW